MYLFHQLRLDQHHQVIHQSFHNDHPTNLLVLRNTDTSHCDYRDNVLS